MVLGHRTRAREGQTERYWSITALSDEDHLTLRLCPCLDDNILNAVDIMLKPLRASSWNAAQCLPRNNDALVF